MVGVAVVIGGLGGLGAVGFRGLIQVVQRVAWTTWSYGLEAVEALPWWWIVLVPAAGGLVVGPLVHFFAREAKGHGVPEVMEAVALRSGFIRPRLVVVKSLASAVTIGTGGSVGREGPIVQIGSALGSTIGQWLSISGRRLRTLVGCGAAAGIAATFNAPVAGALFAVEIILGDFGVSQFSPIVISSVVATVVSRRFLGDFPAFTVPPYAMVSAWELLTYLVLGIVVALVAVTFVDLLTRLEDLFERLPVPPWLRTAIGGLAVGSIAVAFPQILGVGYETIGGALGGGLTVGLLLALVGLKLLATCITLAAGGSGGIFAPSLFLGAMTGGLFGTIVHDLFPSVTAYSGAYALVGMGALVAAATHAPITAILIIFELTSDYKAIVPLMATCIVANLVARRLKRESIYTVKLVRRGIDIERGQEINVLRSLKVEDVMSRQVMAVPASEKLGRLVEDLSEHPHAYCYVVDGDRRLQGVVSLDDLRRSLKDVDTLNDIVIAADLAHRELPRVGPDATLDTVARLFGGRSREELPVVGDDGTLLGVISRRHLMDAYNTELMKRDMTSELGGSLAATAMDEVQLGEGFKMAEIEAPGEFLGRSLGELDVRNSYGVQVVLVRRPTHPSAKEVVEMVPGPQTTISRGDRLVVMGSDDELRRLRAL